jgi:hypothetical protein
MNIFNTLQNKLLNSSNVSSFAYKMRNKRMRIFEGIFDTQLTKEINILDIGGTTEFWHICGYHNRQNIKITLLNLFKEETGFSNIISIKGNACTMSQFCDKSFDIVFSNSLIEHVGCFSDQLLAAKEIARIGKGYFIQTPNYWFPLEPHFFFLGFQFLPLQFKAFFLRNFSLGYFDKTPNKSKSLEIANSVHLLSMKKLKKLFPEASFIKEHVLGLSKSLIAYKN